MTNERGGISPANAPQSESRDSESLISNLRRELREQAQEAHGYLSRLLTHYASQCEPLADLLGVCSQIDNLLVGFGEQAQELERLREYVQHKWDCSYGQHLPGRGDPSETCTCGLAALTSVIPDDTPEEPRPR